MIQIIPQIENVMHHEDRIFRWYTDGTVEYCDLNSSTPIFKLVRMDSVKFATVSSSDELFKDQ